MIQQKLSLFEGEPESIIPGNKIITSQTPIEDGIQAKLTKIYGNKDVDNKVKIAEMVKLFDDEVLPNYRKNFENVMYTSSRSSLDSLMVELYADRAKRSQIVQEKYQMLSQEYQSQAKSFKIKHEEIAESEAKKRQEIIKNFENHYDSI